MIDSKNFTGPDPPDWHGNASVAYFNGKLYYLSGKNSPDSNEYTNRVDVKRSNETS